MSLTSNPAFFQHESRVRPSEVSLQDVKAFEMYPHAGIENKGIFIIYEITIFAQFSVGYAKKTYTYVKCKTNKTTISLTKPKCNNIV